MSAIGFSLTQDGVSPALAQLAGRALQDRIVQSAATVLASLAQRAFDEPGVRPASWPARKKPASHPLLLLSGTMRQSIHVASAGDGKAEIRVPTVYAATHQFGSAKSTGRGGGVPARPFFPERDGQLTAAAVQGVDEVVQVLIGGVA